MDLELFSRCWFLTGPTASGKTAVGVILAERLHAEIISLDSMAVYRGMDIGTTKPTEVERQGIPHHLIDVVAPNEEFSIADYLDAAEQVVKDVQHRGCQVVFVGGTPLYLTALLRGLSSGPPPHGEFRRQIQLEVQQHGTQALHDRLRQVDPLAAAKVHPHDLKRMIRALEVYHLTGERISHQQTQFEESRPASECRVFKLDWPRQQLHERIARRVDQLFETGLVAEVRGLLETYGQLSLTASQAVGYREVLEYLAGEKTLEQVVCNVKTRTRRFAKHQETWFRRLTECEAVSMSTVSSPNDFSPEDVAEDVFRRGADRQVA